jgi:dolichyl-phosphate beta-glucosyltransferase
MKRRAVSVSESLSSFEENHNDVGSPQQQLPPIVVLIPAYNEQERIASTLQQYQEFLLNWQDVTTTSIVVVDDGSTDDTVRVVNDCSRKALETLSVQCIQMPHNGGKGAALACGIRSVVEQSDHHTMVPLLLTQDADGSGDLRYLPEMIQRLTTLLRQQDDENVNYLYAGPAMVVGNRNYNLFSPRGITRWGFQTVVKLIMNDALRVQDSQCGYKLMTLSAARVLYQDLHLQGWSHDVEVLYRAKLLDIPIAEVPIDWQDKDGSKVVASGVAKVSLQMLWDVLRLRWNYSVTKIWQLQKYDGRC